MDTSSASTGWPTVLVTGALAGLLGDACVHPLDTLRARLQASSTATHGHERADTSIASMLLSPPPRESIVRGLWRTARETNDGWRALYRGFSAVAMFTLPGHALYFAGYEMSKQWLLSSSTTSPSHEGGRPALHRYVIHCCAGFVADLMGSLAWTPMDVVKQRLQLAKAGHYAQYRNGWHAVRDILHHHGAIGLYRGYWASLLTYGPYVSLYFMLYEECKWAYQWRHPMLSATSNSSSTPLWWCLAAAGLSASISAVITCPLDVIKTRMQVAPCPSLTSASVSPVQDYSTWWRSLRTIYRHEGWRAFFRGVRPRAMWMSLGTALTMVFYEALKRHAGLMTWPACANADSVDTEPGRMQQPAEVHRE